MNLYLLLLGALAGLYVWALVAFLDTPLIRPLQRWLRTGWRWPLVSCPWCFGFWVSIPIVAAIQWGAWGWVATPLAVLATAALIGVMGGMLTPGAMEPDDVE